MSHPPVIHALLQRHTHDTAFYWTQLDASLSEPGLRAERLLHFARLLAAHREGLAVAGSAALPVALEALQLWRKPGEAFAACTVALASGDATALDAVLPVVARQPDALLRGLIGALADAPHAQAQPFCEAAWPLLAAPAPLSPVQLTRLVAALRACALRGWAVPVLREALAHTSPWVRAAACRAVCLATRDSRGDTVGATALPAMLQDPELAVRAEAAISLAAVAEPLPDRLPALAVLWQCVAAQAQACASATGWNQLQAQRRLARYLGQLAQQVPLGHPDVAALLAHLPPRQALHFVLQHGDPAHLDWVLQAMADPEQARWAGLVWSALTGVDLGAEGLSAAEPPVDLDAPLTRARLDGDQGLPLPHPQALATHPAHAQLQAQAGSAVLMGRARTPAQLAALLRIESNQRQLIRAVAVQSWNAMGLQPRLQLRAGAAELLRQDQALQDVEAQA